MSNPYCKILDDYRELNILFPLSGRAVYTLQGFNRVLIFLLRNVTSSFIEPIRTRILRSQLVRKRRGCSGGAKVLGKLLVPGRPTFLDNSRASAGCFCSGCGWDLFSRLSFSFFLSLWETSLYRLKYCLKGPLNPKQPTNRKRQKINS